MKIKPIGSNMTELHTDNYTILFSYETPVACLDTGIFFKTDRKYSPTTTRHINKWLGGAPSLDKPQSFFDELVK